MILLYVRHEKHYSFSIKLNLYQKELLAIDGSKFRAVNSKDNTFNAEILEKKLKRIDEHITEYLSQMDKTDKSDSDSPAPEHVKAAIQKLTERKEKYQEYLKELLNSEETQKMVSTAVTMSKLQWIKEVI